MRGYLPYSITRHNDKNITLKEIEEHWSSWKVENTWEMVREVSDRIHDFNINPQLSKEVEDLKASLQ